MEITEVRITLRDEEKLKAFASMVFDGCFVVRGLKVIKGMRGLFVSMPSRRLPDGSFKDIAHPINNETRRMIEEKVIGKYQEALASQAAPTAEIPEEPKVLEETPEVREKTEEVKPEEEK
jgi:stage V sporulation protein G